MAFTIFNNWRFNPFTEVTNDVAITNEIHTIGFDDDANGYGIRLQEGIKLTGSLPFNTDTDYTIVEDITGGSTFTEVPRSTSPSVGQFRVDYDANTYYSTSFIEFNASDNGKIVSVDYRGTGTIVKNRYQLSQVTTIPANLTIEGNTNITDDLDVDGDANIDGDLTIGGGLFFGDTSGAPIIGTTENFYTSTTSVTLPSFVKVIHLVVIGGGGGGAGGNNTANIGGGGGASGQYRIGFLSVSGGNTVDITIGTGGGGGAGGNPGTAGTQGGSTTVDVDTVNEVTAVGGLGGNPNPSQGGGQASGGNGLIEYGNFVGGHSDGALGGNGGGFGGGRSDLAHNPGENGIRFGGGGGGGNENADESGGTGSSGIVILRY